MNIYLLENSVNGRTYVGQSIKPRKRFMDHRWKLNNGMHDNPILQQDWERFGERAFTFEVVENNALDGDEAEAKWIDRLNSMYFENGYNIREAGVCGALGEITKQKMSESAPESIHTKESRKKISEASKKWHQENEHPMKGTKRPGEKAGMFGKTHSEETRNKIGHANAKKVKSLETGEVFDSMQECAEHFDCTVGAISNHCNERYKKQKFAFAN